MRHFFHYIAEQLSTEQACELPGIGIFTLSEKPAYWNVGESRIYPPLQEIRFEENTAGPASASLVAFIARQEQLLESVVAFQVEKFVNALKQQLEKGEKPEIPGIGYLGPGSPGRISFTPYDDGTTPFEPVACEMAGTEKAWEAPTAVVPGASADTGPGIPAGDKEEAIPETSYPPFPEEAPRRSVLRWWWVPVGGIAVLAAFFFLYREQLPQGIKDKLPAFMRVRREAPAQIVREQQQPPAVPESDATSATPDSIVQQQPLATPANDSIHYHIVIAVFPSRWRAEKQCDKLRGWGHPVELLVEDSNTYELAMPFTSLPADTTVNLAKMIKNYGPHSHILYK